MSHTSTERLICDSPENSECTSEAGLQGRGCVSQDENFAEYRGKVQQGGKNVTTEDVQAARAEGATDLEIHDTVLIAAAFCMYNRYVDGLATFQPQDPALYRERGNMVARDGNVAANFTNVVASEPAELVSR